ncbi:MAG: CheR family methyltransferase [Thermoanaerobaculales bacterium]
MTAAAIDELIHLIEEVSGIVVPEHDRSRVAAIALEQAGVQGDLEIFLDRLRQGPSSEEWRVLLGRITIKESYLFRGRAQFEILENIILPEVAQRRAEPRLRVWCAGSARGEEPATLAIVLSRCQALEGWDWRIVATDVDDSALEEGRRGVFGRRAVARVSPEDLARHFRACGASHFELEPSLRERIVYRHLNLAQDPLALVESPFDIVFLRNVLIYFSREWQEKVVAAVADNLVDDGVLFLGPSESLLHLRSNFQARDLGACFCYLLACRKRAAGNLNGAPPSRDHTIKGEGGTSLPGRARPDPPINEPVLEDQIEAIVGALATSRSEVALKLLEPLTIRFPENPILRSLKGMALEGAGRVEAAVSAYRGALYLAPYLKEIRFLLARGLDQLGRGARAEREYRAVLATFGASQAVRSRGLAMLGFPSADEIMAHCREALGSRR